MNYLAHIFLSGNDCRLQIGNFIGDFVKGSKHAHYPPEIQDGIKLHRLIDEFTDSHPVVRETVKMLKPTFGRYSGIMADMYFDYFLAIHFTKYHKKSLRNFACKFYFHLLLNYKHLPVKVKGFVFHFVTTNRLTKYSHLEGLRQSLQIMEQHKSKAIKPDLSISYLLQNQAELELKFFSFMPDLIEFAEERRKEVKKNSA